MTENLKFLPTLMAMMAACLCHGVDVTAKSAAVFDAATGRMLWSKDPDTPRYPASTTKIMTGLLVVENLLPEETIAAPADVEKVEGSSMHLRPQEKVTAKNMLAAILLRSANDGCYATAIHMGGTLDGFARMMNERAKSLGCRNTTFHNPHGLNNKDHKTTARDLGLIACEAMRHPWFEETVRQRKIVIQRGSNQEDLWMVNKNKLLREEPTVDGIKTGYTSEAGSCFVGSATRNGTRVITVVLASQDWGKDTRNLLEWAFREHGTRTLAEKGDTVGKAKVQDGRSRNVVAVLDRPVKALAPLGESVPHRMKFVPVPALKAPIRKGQKIGEAVFADDSGWTYRLPAVAAESVQTKTWAQRVAGSPFATILILGMVGGAVAAKRRAARRKKRVRRRQQPG